MQNYRWGKARHRRDVFFDWGECNKCCCDIGSTGAVHAQYLWGLGVDPASETVLRALDDEGVDTSKVVQHESLRASYSTVLIAKTGERTILNYHGTLPTTKDIERLLETAETPDWCIQHLSAP